MNIPRAEHPNPQWERKNWRNLNGLWEFEWDYGCSAVQRRLWEKETFAHTILVPFCPESKLSGLAHTDFIPGVTYRRTFSLSEQELSGRVLLHFGAVDYEAWVYVNGQPAGTHKGGYTSFSLDVTPYVTAGENTLFVAARDDVRSGLQPKGKQADQYYSSGCDYTRTTGIWQTVWLEFVPETYLQYARYYPDPQNGCVTVSGLAKGEGTLRLTALWEGKPVGEKTIAVQDGFFTTQLDLEEIHLWEAGKGGLYTLLLSLENDQVSSYFGLRTVAFQGRKFLLNGKPLFQRFVLDQGFYPDGIYTAPTEEDLIQDITLSFAAGFNGARLHEKVFEPRFLYHCDRLGYLVWGEFPNWGLDHSQPQAVYSVLPEWLEEVERDFNHPSIIGWCPFNETWDQNGRKQYDDVLRAVYLATKSADPTRPCIDTSGNYHVETDIYDLHDYDQNPESFKAHYDELAQGGELWEQVNQRQPYPRQKYDGKKPVFLSEYGGIGWALDEKAWGYGNSPKSPEEFIQRFRGLADALLDNPEIMGLCYTQLTNVEQEQNGLFTYEREPKFPVETFRDILSRKAAIED